jgi:hypothetical protein
MLDNVRLKIQLQRVIDDPASTAVERTEAQRALAELIATDQPTQQPSRRRGRDAPMTQEDEDADIENWYRRDLLASSLTSSDRSEIFQGFDPSTQAILDAFGNQLLWLFSDTDIQVLIDAYTKSTSEFVRAKTIDTIKHIATYSPSASSKTQAQQFLNQLDQPTPEHED